MSRSQNAFNKKEKEKKRLQKRKAKQQRKEERKALSSQEDSGLDNMMAYVDADGNIVDTPPDESEKEKIDASTIEIGIPKKVDEPPQLLKGRVSFFDHNKGFGFINEDGTRERFFVHTSSLTSPIEEGDKVTFLAQKGARGMDAINVTVVG